MFCHQLCPDLLDLRLTSIIENVIPGSADADIVGAPLPTKIIIPRAAQDAIIAITADDSTVGPRVIAGSTQDQIIGSRSTTKCRACTPDNVGQCHRALRRFELVGCARSNGQIISARNRHNVGSRRRSQDAGQYE
jgi:hypothetical protein